eukprot:CAMPEP_0174262890 /NCGR_PEP_ID=MMETSP0439-20130205/16052_1 /TAXON_ID=0 /ORGANISM="Stereomyxa ramosa, Strain Chinc5" /LENGTH=319 /DNA_ID=CAMNT_0015347925 /DNA_START=220 /DNA_END=1175 /DNA_ORIENTATION=-
MQSEIQLPPHQQQIRRHEHHRSAEKSSTWDRYKEINDLKIYYLSNSPQVLYQETSKNNNRKTKPNNTTTTSQRKSDQSYYKPSKKHKNNNKERILEVFEEVLDIFGNTEEEQAMNINNFMVNGGNRYFHGYLSTNNTIAALTHANNFHGHFIPFLVRLSRHHKRMFVISHKKIKSNQFVHFLVPSHISHYGVLTFLHNINGQITYFTDFSFLLHKYFTVLASIGKALENEVYSTVQGEKIESEYETVQICKQQVTMIDTYLNNGIFCNLSNPTPLQQRAITAYFQENNIIPKSEPQLEERCYSEEFYDTSTPDPCRATR